MNKKKAVWFSAQLFFSFNLTLIESKSRPFRCTKAARIQDFIEGDEGVYQPAIGKIVSQNCMIMKEIRPWVGWCVSSAPLDRQWLAFVGNTVQNVSLRPTLSNRTWPWFSAGEILQFKGIFCGDEFPTGWQGGCWLVGKYLEDIQQCFSVQMGARRAIIQERVSFQPFYLIKFFVQCST